MIYQLRGESKKLANCRMLANYNVILRPLDTVSAGPLQESYFYQQKMLLRMLGLQLQILDTMQREVLCLRDLDEDQEVSGSLRTAQLVLAQAGQILHNYTMLGERRVVLTVSYITGSAYKIPKVGKERVFVDPVEEAKKVIKLKKMVKEGRGG